VPSDLFQHRSIRARLRSGQIYKWEFEKGAQKVQIDVPGGLTLDENSLMREAALAGAGLTYIGERSVAEDLSAGRLIAVLEDWTPPYPGLSLYFAGRRHIPARLRALIDLIRELDYR
jgi:DNA-binding transcriptional LysR family regulator